jgi:hypothetical protein
MPRIRLQLIRRVLLLAGVVLALGASEAQAHTTIIEPTGSHHPYQQWVDEARVPTPAGTITVVESTLDCGEPDLGCTDGTTIWVEWPANRFTFLHELGHLFAFQHPELAAFTSERFANSYSLCARLTRIAPGWNYLNDEGMRGSRLQKICEAIRTS